MKLKLSDIINSILVLKELGNRKFPGKTSFRIQRNLKLIEPEIKTFEEEKQKIVEKYAKNKKEDGSFYIEQADTERINEELLELLNQEIEINILQIGIDELLYEITPNELMKIEWMIDEDSV